MSLSIALNNALTGLRSASSQADIIANNVSNALTEDYGRREAVLSATVVGGQGGGVGVDGVSRAASPFLAEARRLAEADAASSETIGAAQRRLADALGEPGSPGALSTRADDFEAALSAAGDTPESPALLSVAISAARDYVAAVNGVAAEVNAVRSDADASIAIQVDALNRSLGQIRDLNGEIRTRSAIGADISALLDQRDRLVAGVAEIIPLKIADRPNDEIAIYAKNGGQLLDGRVFELEFTPTRVVTADKTLAAGNLSGLTQNGVSIRIGEGGGLLDGGSLSAAFEVRDRIGESVTSDLDLLAADLIQRTEGLAEDTTLVAGDPGLFTDDGSAFNAAAVTGLAVRLELNAAVDPDQGGETYRLRDGLSAATPGEVGRDDLLRALQDAFAESVTAPATAEALTGARGAAGFAAELSSAVFTATAAEEGAAAFARGRADVLFDAERSEVGVDTDQELSRLLIVEQTFAASAKVVEVIDDLLARLNQI